MQLKLKFKVLDFPGGQTLKHILEPLTFRVHNVETIRFGGIKNNDKTLVIATHLKVKVPGLIIIFKSCDVRLSVGGSFIFYF